MDTRPTPPGDDRESAPSRRTLPPASGALRWLRLVPGGRIALAVVLPLATAVAVFAAIQRPAGAPAETIRVLGETLTPPGGKVAPASEAAAPEAADAPAPSPSPTANEPEPPPPPRAAAPVPPPAPASPTPAAVETVAPSGTATATPVPVHVPPPAPDPSPSPVPEPVPCGADDVHFAITTDKKAYGEGETVHITMTIHNHTSRACDIPEPHNGCNSGFVVVNAGGRQVWPTGPQPMYPCFLQYSNLEAGATREAHFQWDQKEWACDGSEDRSCYQRVAPGEYLLRGYWIGGVEATTGFHVL